MTIIAFCGPMKSGKSTAAIHLERHHGFKRMRFAQPLKDMLRAIGLDNDELDGDFKSRPSNLLCGQTPRHAMQTLGTEWGRQCIHPDFWANLWKLDVEDRMRYGKLNGHPLAIVNDDLRFPNELNVIKDIGGIVVRIKRSGHEYDPSHESEAHELPSDYVIENNGLMSELFDKLDRFLERLEG